VRLWGEKKNERNKYLSPSNLKGRGEAVKPREKREKRFGKIEGVIGVKRKDVFFLHLRGGGGVLGVGKKN